MEYVLGYNIEWSSTTTTSSKQPHLMDEWHGYFNRELFFLQENTIIDMLSCKVYRESTIARAQIWQAWNGLLLPWESGFLRHRNCKGGEAERQMMLKTDQRKDWDKSPFFLPNTTTPATPTIHSSIQTHPIWWQAVHFQCSRRLTMFVIILLI